MHELEALISACGKVIGTFLQGLKDPAADPGELARIEWIDINTEAKTLSLKEPVKGHNPRMVPVSEDFLRRLQALPQGKEYVFRGLMGLSANFYRQRKRLAVKLNNPRLAEIKFTTFRHWKATMEYHKTKDVIHVQQLLGHKNIQNTMIYINLNKLCSEEKTTNSMSRSPTTLMKRANLWKWDSNTSLVTMLTARSSGNASNREK